MRNNSKIKVVTITIIAILGILLLGKLTIMNHYIKLTRTSLGNTEDGYYYKVIFIISKNECTVIETHDRKEMEIEKNTFKVNNKKFNELLEYMVHDKDYFNLEEGYGSGEEIGEIEVRYFTKKKHIYLPDDQGLYNRIHNFIYETTNMNF